ncbi:MAG: Imm8 family immunity protein [Thermoleophilia bacterium]
MGRHYLIMLNYNLERLKNFIVSYVESCTGDTWQEVAEKLGRLGKWEFEDYQEYSPTDS